MMCLPCLPRRHKLHLILKTMVGVSFANLLIIHWIYLTTLTIDLQNHADIQ